MIFQFPSHLNFNSHQGRDEEPSAMALDEGDLRLNDIVMGVVGSGAPLTSDGSELLY